MAHFGLHIALPLPIATLMSGSPPFSLPCSPSLHRVGKAQPTGAKFELLGGLLVAIFPIFGLLCMRECRKETMQGTRTIATLACWAMGPSLDLLY